MTGERSSCHLRSLSAPSTIIPFWFARVRLLSTREGGTSIRRRRQGVLPLPLAGCWAARSTRGPPTLDAVRRRLLREAHAKQKAAPAGYSHTAYLGRIVNSAVRLTRLSRVLLLHAQSFRDAEQELEMRTAHPSGSPTQHRT